MLLVQNLSGNSLSSSSFILYRFSIWELENHSECVEADKYPGPRCFLEIVDRLLGLESLDLIDW